MLNLYWFVIAANFTLTTSSKIKKNNPTDIFGVLHIILIKYYFKRILMTQSVNARIQCNVYPAIVPHKTQTIIFIIYILIIFSQ